MGSVLYDFLNDSVLFKSSELEGNFGKLTDKDLKAELSRYREFSLEHLDAMASEVLASKCELKVCALDELPDKEKLLQSAFYIEEFVAVDPLFKLSQEANSSLSAMLKHEGFSIPEFDRALLCETLRSMKDLVPLVAGNYLKFLPTSYLFEKPKELPVIFSPTQFREVIPESLREFFAKKTTVASLKILPEGFALEKELKIGRHIAVHFEGQDLPVCFSLYNNELIASPTESEDDVAEFRMTLTGEPTKREFEYWVEESKNRAAYEMYRQTYEQVRLSKSLDCSLLTRSRFKSDLLRQSHQITNEIKSYTANSMLNLELPFLEHADASVLMSMRNNDGEAFATFRKELEKHFRELRLIKDPIQLAQKIENVFHELHEVQGNQISTKVKNLQRQLGINAAIMVGGLVGAIETNPLSLIATIMAGMNGYKTYEDYRQNSKQNPAFFLWKVLDESDTRNK